MAMTVSSYTARAFRQDRRFVLLPVGQIGLDPDDLPPSSHGPTPEIQWSPCEAKESKSVRQPDL